MIEISVEGLEEKIRALQKLAKLDSVKAAIRAGALHIKGKINIYPPSTIANNPAQKRWYERGYGSRWMTKYGVHGRQTSETLGRKWTIKETNGGMGAVIGNNVSYASWVHDPQMQTGFHAAHGWKTTEQVADAERDTVTREIVSAIDREIDTLGLG